MASASLARCSSGGNLGASSSHDQLPYLKTAKMSSPSGELSDDDLRTWMICWRVNAAFAAEFDNQQATLCLRCRETIPPDTLLYRSLFISRAVESPCSHTRSGSLCGNCDMDIVFKVTRGDEK